MLIGFGLEEGMDRGWIANISRAVLKNKTIIPKILNIFYSKLHL